MIRFGVIGCGRRIYGIIEECRKWNSEVTVVGVVDPDQKGVLDRMGDQDKKHVQFYSSVDEMVKGSQPDALLIGTRCALHATYACEAQKYNIPLFLEKPVAIDYEGAYLLEKCFASSKCPVIVSFPLRVSPLCEYTLGMIKEGKIGRPEYINARNYVGYGTVYFEDFYRDFKNTQGLFLQKATHDLDYIAMLMNSTITRVGAMAMKGRVWGGNKPEGLRCSNCNETRTCLESPFHRKHNLSSYTFDDHNCVFSRDCGNPQDGMNEDASTALLEFESGAQGVYSQLFFVRRNSAMRGAVITGYHGSLDFDWVRNDLNYYGHHKPIDMHITPAEGLSHFGGDAELAIDFLNMIQYNQKPRVGIQEGLQSVFVCLAAKESADKGEFVNVHQVRF